MGKRGPKSRLGGRFEPIRFRPDEETIVALSQDLAALRALRPRASMADVLRSWARNSEHSRAVVHEARLLDQIRRLEDLDVERSRELQALRAAVAGFRDQAVQRQAKDVEVAVRALQGNQDLVRHVQDLVRLEAGGLQAASAYPVLQRARRGVSSWQDLLSKRGDANHAENQPP